MTVSGRLCADPEGARQPLGSAVHDLPGGVDRPAAAQRRAMGGPGDGLLQCHCLSVIWAAMPGIRWPRGNLVVVHGKLLVKLFPTAPTAMARTPISNRDRGHVDRHDLTYGYTEQYAWA